MADESADAVSQTALKNMKEAQKIADALYSQSERANGAAADALGKIATVYDKIAKQNAELVKLRDELNDLEKKALDNLKKRQKAEEELKALQKNETEEGKKQAQQAEANLENIKKEQALTRESIQLKRSATAEATKSTKEMKKQVEEMSKQGGLLGKVFSSSKVQLFGYLASIASVSSAVAQLGKLSQDVLDISVLSGNYAALKGGMTDLAATAVKLQYGISSANVGLRFLGYSSEEVKSSFMDLSATIGRFDGSLAASKRVAELTETSGRLARMLGVTLPEATQYMIETNLKFSANNGDTAASLYEIYSSAKQFNEEAGKTVLRARDVTKVMFDLARESKAAALDQGYLSKTLTSNILQLQSQGKNYQESLDAASMYVKKLTTDAPNWTKILAGRELASALKPMRDELGNLITGPDGLVQIGSEMEAQLEKARPGLASRVKDIITNTKDEFTKQQLLQSALEGTGVGIEAMESGLKKLIDQTGASANQALQKIYNISAQEADAMIRQVKMADEIKQKKLEIYKLDEEAAAKQLQDTYGLDEAHAKYLANKQNGDRLTAFLRKKAESEATDKISTDSEIANAKRIGEIENLKMQLQNESSAGIRGEIQSQIDALEGVKSVEAKTEKDLSGVQGGTAGEIIAWGAEAVKNPLTKLVLGVAGITKLLSDWFMARAAMAAGEKLLGKSGPSDLGGLLSGAGKAAGRGGAGQVLKTALRGGLKVGGAAALLEGAGTAYTAYSDYQAAEQSGASAETLRGMRNKGIGKTAGATAGGGLGAWGGAAGGAAIGTLILPGVGTVLGGLIGAAVGGIAGAEGGKYLGEKAGDLVTPTSAPLKDIPMSAAPPGQSPEAAAANAAAQVQAQMGRQTGGVTQTANIVRGAQGADIEIITKLPIAQAMAYNLSLANRMGVAASTGG